MITTIIFDWDDVITLGSKEGYFACYHKALEGVGVVLPPGEEQKRILAKWGETHRDELGELLREQPQLLDRASEIYEKELFGDTYVDELFILDGTAEVLKTLSLSYKLGVATGIHPGMLYKRVIPRFHIPDVFSEVLSSYDIPDPSKRKPDPYTALALMRRLGSKPEETVVVGDAKNDVLMAERSGCVPVVVLTGHLNKKQAEELGVRYIIPDLRSMPDILSYMACQT
ncbi:MAG: HAD family hydrolase [Candidatus Magasanikbacteria bacterium]|nr:HAD family hydrolase [Candidatus Magasanikbacteria bacterium]